MLVFEYSKTLLHSSTPPSYFHLRATCFSFWKQGFIEPCATIAIYAFITARH